MHATIFSGLFTYATLTHEKMYNDVSADMKNRRIALDATNFSLINGENRV